MWHYPPMNETLSNILGVLVLASPVLLLGVVFLGLALGEKKYNND